MEGSQLSVGMLLSYNKFIYWLTFSIPIPSSIIMKNIVYSFSFFFSIKSLHVKTVFGIMYAIIHFERKKEEASVKCVGI